MLARQLPYLNIDSALFTIASPNGTHQRIRVKAEWKTYQPELLLLGQSTVLNVGKDVFFPVKVLEDFVIELLVRVCELERVREDSLIEWDVRWWTRFIDRLRFDGHGRSLS